MDLTELSTTDETLHKGHKGVETLNTYQDLLACGDDEERRQQFILKVVEEHKQSDLYKDAIIAEKQYENENPTINAVNKVVYDLYGIAHQDIWAPNNKIACNFYQFATDQEVSYLLRNGIKLKESTKKKFGKKFESTVSRITTYARVQGRSYGFYDFNKIVPYKVTEFAPLYNERNKMLNAGVYFWQIDSSKPEYLILFEPEGYTRYIHEGVCLKLDGQVRNKYKKIRSQSEYDGTQIGDFENYKSLPIVEMRNGEYGKSSLNGKRNTLDAIDKAISELINNVDEGTLIYWAMVNCNAMSEIECEQFIANIKKSHVAKVEGDGGANVVPHIVEAPVQSSIAAINELRNQAYEDFMAFDYRAIAASNQTATAINAAYTPLDEKCDKIEDMISDFLLDIFELADVDDTPSYTRNRLTNQLEELQKLVIMQPYVSEEYIREKMLTINGDIDQLATVTQQADTESMSRANMNQKKDDADA